VVRRHPDLFDRIADFGALMRAARRAIRGKRRKPGAAAFMAGLETEVLRLERELRTETWRPGRYVEIEVFVPKHRIVSAAPFRDAVFDPSRRPDRSPAASSAAAPGTTTHGTCARPTVTTTHRTTETTISASGLPRHPAVGAGVFTETSGVQGCVQGRS
jgi:hypothetical protein